MRNRTDLAILIVALLLFAAIAALRATAPRTHPSFPSTYDTGANGYAGLFEFLQREKIDAARYELPLGELPARATIVFAGDYTIDSSMLSGKESAALEKWVGRGGRLIVLGSVFPLARDALGLPKARSAAAKEVWTGCGFHGKRLVAAGEFASAMRVGCERKRSVLLEARGGAVAVELKHGRGTIVYVVTPSVFDNAHLAMRDNAAFAYDLFAGGTPMFDERVYGYEAGRSFWEVMPRPVIWAVILSLFGLLVAVIAANVRLAPARALERDDERDSFAYIESLARMLQRGGAEHDIIARLARAAGAFRSPAAGDERGRAAFETLRRLAERRDAGPREVLAAGTIFAQLRKDYEW